MGKCFLYRHFDKNGLLLYVGISINAINRLLQHQSSSVWFGDISRVEIEEHDSVERATTAEAEAIRDENPKYNKGNIFTCHVKAKGWKMKDLAERWGGLTPRQMSRIAANPKKIHWDAICGLPDK